MSWYNDKINNTTAQLALQGAGAGANAVGAVAKIPLDMADRRLAEFDADTQRIKAQTPEHVAQINALAKQKAAELGYKGKELTAKAKLLAAQMNSLSREYVANVGLAGKKVTAAAKDNATGAYDRRTKAQRANNIDDNFTKQITSTDKNYTQRQVAKLNLKGKKVVKPKATIRYDADGNVIGRTVVKPYAKELSGDDFLIEMEQKAKKRKGRR